MRGEHFQPRLLTSAKVDAAPSQAEGQATDCAGVGDKPTEPFDPAARLRLGQARIAAELAQERDRLRGLRTVRDAVLSEIRDDVRQRADRQRFELAGRASLLIIRALQLL